MATDVEIPKPISSGATDEPDAEQAATAPPLPEGYSRGAVVRQQAPPLPVGYKRGASTPTATNAAPKPASGPTAMQTHDQAIADKVVQYGKGLANSIGVPESGSEYKAAAEDANKINLPNVARWVGGPAADLALQAYGSGKQALKRIVESGHEAYEAGQNIAQGGPVLQNLAKPAASLVEANVGAVPFVGEPTVQAGKDIAAGNKAHAAGELTGAIGQIVVPELHEHIFPGEPAKLHATEVKQMESNVANLAKDREVAQTKYDAALAEHNKHTASHAQGIGSPEKVVKEVTKTKDALDEAVAHHELAKEALAKKIAAGPPKAAPKSVTAAPEVPAEQIEARPTLTKLGEKKSPYAVSPAHATTTVPQEPTAAPRPSYGRIELAGGQGTMGKPLQLTEGTPEGPQVPKEGMPKIKLPEPKPVTDEGALRDLKATKGEVVESPEKKVGRLLQEALKPEEKAEYKGEERREKPRPATMSPTEIEAALKNRKPVHTPFDVTEGAMDTIKRDQLMPKHPAEEAAAAEAPKKEVFYRGTNAEEARKIEESGKITPDAFSSGHLTPDKGTAEAYAKANGGKVYTVNAEHVPEKDLAHYRETGRGPIQLSSEVPTVEHAGRPNIPKEEQGYAAKKEELVPAGEEGREPAKSASEYHPAVQQKVGELSDTNLRKLAKAHGLNPEEYDFNVRDDHRHRVERDKLAKEVTEQMGEDEKINLGRAAEQTEKQGLFESADKSAQGRAARAEKMFPRLRGPVDENGNPTVRGGSGKITPKDFLEEVENHPDLHFSSEYEGDLENDKGTTINLKAVSNPDRVRISDLQSSDKGKGGATDMLKTVTKLADKHGMALELTASPYGDESTRLNHEQLRAFYEKHGFIPEKGKDEALGYMVREPKTPQAVSGGAPETTVGSKEEADRDTEHFANAKKELGPNASISDVSKRAQEMKDAHAQLAAHEANGGSTFSSKGKDLNGTDKYSVEAYPDRTEQVDKLTLERLEEFKKKNADVLSKEDHAVGTWKDPDTGKAVLDVAKVYADRDEAIAAGKAANQKAIYHLGGEGEIQTGGTGIPEPSAANAKLSDEELIKKGFTKDDIENGKHLPAVSGGSVEKKLPTGDQLIKKYGESDGDPAHTTFILPDGRGVANTGIEHDRMLGGTPTGRVPPRERFVEQGNIRVRPRSGGKSGREVALSIPESGITTQQLDNLKKMAPQLGSGAVLVEIGKRGGDYRVIPYGEASDKLESTIRELAPIKNDKEPSEFENEKPSLEKLGEKKKKSPYGNVR